MDHESMDHGSMDHGSMDHGSMDHGSMDHDTMGHGSHGPSPLTTVAPMSAMDHAAMGHGAMDHSSMGHDSPAAAAQGHDHSASPDGGMAMWFHGGCQETILFSWWRFSSVGGLLGSCLILALLATLYEGLKVLREVLQRRYSGETECGCCPGGALPSTPVAAMNGDAEERRGLDDGRVRVEGGPDSACRRMLRLDHVVQTLLHGVQVVTSYLLMLVFMTYNVWLCLAVVLGAALGHFLFVPFRPRSGSTSPSLAAFADHCN